MLSFLRLNLLRQLDKDGILDVSHYENILLKAFEKAGFDEQNKPATVEDFEKFRLAIDTEIERAEGSLEEARKKASSVVENGEYADKEKEELKSIVRKKFQELFDFYDSQKEMALTTFDEEFQRLVRFNYFHIDHISNLTPDVKDELFQFIFNKAKNNANSFDDICQKVEEYGGYLDGVIGILLPETQKGKQPATAADATERSRAEKE